MWQAMILLRPPISRNGLRLHGWSLLLRPRSRLSTRLASTQALNPAPGTTAKPVKGYQSTHQRPAYPERLLIYHAGTFKTALVSWGKVTTVFLFSFACIFVAPSFYYDPNVPAWVVPGVIIAGAIPMILVATSTAPYVASVVLFVPRSAKANQRTLFNYLETNPSSTRLEFTTLRLSGLQKRSTILLSNLRVLPWKLGRLANLEVIQRITTKNVAKKKWWAPFVDWLAEPRNKFYVGTSTRTSQPHRLVWETVWKVMEKNKS